MPITPSIFGHIALDAELQGTFGVQGNTFENTFSYLNDYLTNHIKAKVTPNLETFRKNMTQLIEIEQRINDVSDSTEAFNILVDDLNQKITTLSKGEGLILPGGWQNSGNGHAMLYEFQRTETDDILFSIYNAGAGLHFHEKKSSKHSELYYPIKTFKVPADAPLEELPKLLSRLLIPQILKHQTRNQEAYIKRYNADDIYNAIEWSLAFLNAQKLPAQNRHREELTTAGQISGTCAQRSIHQMLKYHFDTLAQYRRFMFDYKCYAIQDYIGSASWKSSSKIRQDIELAIENNLKILQLPGVFETEDEQKKAFQNLQNLKRQLNTTASIEKVSEKTQTISTKHQPYDLPYTTHTPLFSNTIAPNARKPHQIYPTFEGPLISQLEQLLEYSLTHIEDRPFHTNNCIEHALLYLPIPEADYHEISSNDQWLAACDLLFKIQANYYEALEQSIQGTLANEVIISTKLLMLYDYFYSQATKPIADHSLHQFLVGIYANALPQLVNSPYGATMHVDSDKEIETLAASYEQHAKTNNKKPKDVMLTHYKNILESEPLLKKELLKSAYENHYEPEKLNLLREKELLELCFLFDQLDNNCDLKNNSPLDNETFKPLLDKLKMANKLDHFLLNHRRIKRKTEKTAEKPTILFYPETFRSRAYLDFQCPTSKESEINNIHLYSIADSNYNPIETRPAKESLKTNHTENEIQTHKPQSTLATHITQRYYQLNNNTPHLQIQISLDYFNRTIQKLENLTDQLYLEANLFQPGLLRKALLADPEFEHQIDQFTEKGIHYFTDVQHKISPPVIFFLHLKRSFNQYLAELDKTRAQGRLHATLMQINDYLQQQTDPEILTGLHEERLLAILACHTHEKATSKNPSMLLGDALTSIFYLKLNPTTSGRKDCRKQATLLNAEHTLSHWVQSVTPEILQAALIPVVCAQLNITVNTYLREGYQLKGNYPLFTLSIDDQSYLIDAERGHIFKDGELSLLPIPNSIKESSILKKFTLEQEQKCFISPDERYVEFITPTDHFRMRLKPLSLGNYASDYDKQRKFDAIVQKKIIIDGNSTWFQYVDLGKPGQTFQLPKSLTDEDLAAWFEVQDETTKVAPRVFISHHTNKLYDVEYKKNVSQLRVVNTNDMYLKENSSYHSTLESFEDASFFRVHLDDNNTGEVYLDRYGLMFKLSDGSIIEPDSGFQIFKPSEAPFDISVAQLNITNGTEQRCLIPIQPFYLKRDDSHQNIAGEYYALKHKISDPISSYDKKNFPTHYTNSNSYITYPIVNGKPKPNSAADGLYLFYLYLATHEHQKAWDVLTHIKKYLPLIGSTEECIYFYWISTGLPLYASDEKFASPRDVACQLKALALCTDFFLDGKSFEQLVMPKYKLSTHAEKKKYLAGNLDEFQNKFRQKLYDCYVKYQKMQRHLSKRFQLDDRTCESLLKYALPKNNTYLGALGHEVRRIHLKKLTQELQRLSTHVEQNTSQVPPSFHTRIKDIEHTLLQEKNVMKRETKLELITLDLTLSDDDIHQVEKDKGIFSYRAIRRAVNIELRSYTVLKPGYIRQDVLDQFYRQPFGETYVRSSIIPDEKLSKALNALSSDMTENDFMNYLPLYFYMARDHKISREKLNRFCIHALKGSNKIPLAEQKTLIPRFSLLIYLVIHNPHHFKYGESLGIIELIKKFEHLSAPAIQMYQTKDVFDAPLQTVQEMKNELLEAQKTSSLQTIPLSPNITIPPQKTTWDAILIDANQALLSEHAIEIEAGQLDLVTSQDLLQCYTRSDPVSYKALTGLSEEQCSALHRKIHACITREVQAEHGERFQTDNQKETLTDPTLMLFQHEAKILLRPKQVKALQNLLSTPNNPYQLNECIEKIIMGGGKSKVILPILAQKKANGVSLPIIEVPHALFATNYLDLNNTSERLFNQHAYPFKFDRDSDCSPKQLEHIYQQFIDMMNNRDYLITTGQSMQSLELKYLELLMQKPSTDDEQATWSQQIFWLGKITDFIRTRGDAVIDEVHEGLLLKRKLNYTLGTPKTVSNSMIQHTINLYQFLDTLEPINPDILQNGLINQLLISPESPLQIILEQHKNTFDSFKESLHSYLSNQEKPSFIDDLDKKTQDTLAFYKEQLRLLPDIYTKRYQVYFGPSKIQTKSEASRALAIPYTANDKPNERSRFGNPLEALNLTTQGMRVGGVPLGLFKHAIIQLQAEARKEQRLNPARFASLNDTPTGKKAAQLLPNQSLANIDISNPSALSKLHEQNKYNKSLIYHVLQHQVLNQVAIEPTILHSNAYNHVDIYRSIQGISGTPYNHTTYHQRLQFDASQNKDDHQTIWNTIERKNTRSQALSFESLDTFLDQLKTHAMHETHALIDMNATFVGLSNLVVAQKIANTLCNLHTPSLKYVLYFDENDVLCALNTNNLQSIILGTSDPLEINRVLRCSPKERFTYYDQAHTLGADIQQPATSSAICLFDETTSHTKFLQGIMRMRGLINGEQEIQLVTPADMPQRTISELQEAMQAQEEAALKKENIDATLAKMNHLIRQEALLCLSKIDNTNVHEKNELAINFKSYFTETHNDDLFENYGNVYQDINTETLFQEHKKSLLARWKTKAPQTYSATQLQNLEQALDQLINQSLKHCADKCKGPISPKNNTEVEVQKEQEQKKEVELLQEQEKEYQKILLEPVEYQPWTNTDINTLITTGMVDNGYVSLLNKQLKTDLFSNNIFVTQNYANTYKSQTEMLNPHIKPVYTILFRQSSEGGLSAYILSNTEAEEFIEKFNPLSHQKSKYWITTTQHNSITGQAPQDILSNPEYQSLMEQIQFFNAEFDGLLEQTTTQRWLHHKTEEKLEYLDRNILPYREYNHDQFLALNASLVTALEAGVNYMKQYTLEDLSDINWEALFPHILPPERSLLNTLRHTCLRLIDAAKANSFFAMPDNIPYQSLGIKGCELLHHFMAELKIKQSDPTPDINYLHFLAFLSPYSEDADFQLSNILQNTPELTEHINTTGMITFKTLVSLAQHGKINTPVLLKVCNDEYKRRYLLRIGLKLTDDELTHLIHMSLIDVAKVNSFFVMPDNIPYQSLSIKGCERLHHYMAELKLQQSDSIPDINYLNFLAFLSPYSEKADIQLSNIFQNTPALTEHIDTTGMITFKTLVSLAQHGQINNSILLKFCNNEDKHRYLFESGLELTDDELTHLIYKVEHTHTLSILLQKYCLTENMLHIILENPVCNENITENIINELFEDPSRKTFLQKLTHSPLILPALKQAIINSNISDTESTQIPHSSSFNSDFNGSIDLDLPDSLDQTYTQSDTDELSIISDNHSKSDILNSDNKSGIAFDLNSDTGAISVIPGNKSGIFLSDEQSWSPPESVVCSFKSFNSCRDEDEVSNLGEEVDPEMDTDEKSDSDNNNEIDNSEYSKEREYFIRLLNQLIKAAPNGLSQITAAYLQDKTMFRQLLHTCILSKDKDIAEELVLSLLETLDIDESIKLIQEETSAATSKELHPLALEKLHQYILKRENVLVPVYTKLLEHYPDDENMLTLMGENMQTAPTSPADGWEELKSRIYKLKMSLIKDKISELEANSKSGYNHGSKF